MIEKGEMVDDDVSMICCFFVVFFLHLPSVNYTPIAGDFK